MNHNFDKFIISKRNVVPPRGVQKNEYWHCIYC